MRRELCQLFSLGPGAREDVATPLPSRKMFRSLSMREATRLRHRAQLGHRHSFMGAGAGLGKGAGRGRHKGGVCQPGDCLESQTLLLSLTPSSTDSSARSSFSGAGAGQGAGHPRHVTLVTQRQEASC